MSNKEELYRKVALNLINKCISHMHDDCWEYGCSEERQNELLDHINHYLELLDAEDQKERFEKEIKDFWSFEEEDWLE